MVGKGPGVAVPIVADRTYRVGCLLDMVFGDAMNPAKQRRKRCKVCGTLFFPRDTFHVTCSQACAYQFATQKAGRDHRKRVERKETRDARRRIKTKAQWRTEAQQAFNAYIRERDKNEPCISCGRSTEAKRNAGHYRSVGAAPELRYDERNCHGQCEHCNNYLSGNIAGYRPRLIEKIGLEAVEDLEREQPQKKYTVEELIEIKLTYKAKLRELRE